MSGRAYTTNPVLATLARQQGAKVQHVKCLEPRYGPGERKLCTTLCLPPLICRDRPALLVPTPRGAKTQSDVRNAPLWEPPWGGELVTGYRIPIARYGAIRSFCRAVPSNGNSVMLLCQGEPDWSEVGRVRKSAKRIGGSVDVVYTRLYGWSTVKLVAESIPRMKIVVLPPRGVPHLVVAALRYAVEELGLQKLPPVKPLYDPSLDSPERNRVKNAVDWMCSMGDEIACYASKYYHKPMWNRLVRNAI